MMKYMPPIDDLRLQGELHAALHPPPDVETTRMWLRQDRRRRRQRQVAVFLAAAALLVTGLVGSRWWSSAAGHATLHLAEGGHRSFAAGEELALADAGVVELHLRDGRDRLSVTGTGSLRWSADAAGEQVALSAGRLTAAIAPRPDRPLTITTPAGAVQVIGTRFTVEAGASLLVAVQEGSVRVGSGDTWRQLGAGERYRHYPAARPRWGQDLVIDRHSPRQITTDLLDEAQPYHAIDAGRPTRAHPAPLELAPAGHPRRLLPDQWALRPLPPVPAVPLRLSWRGQGTVATEGFEELASGAGWRDVQAVSRPERIMLTATDPTDPLRDLRLVRRTAVEDRHRLAASLRQQLARTALVRVPAWAASARRPGTWPAPPETNGGRFLPGMQELLSLLATPEDELLLPARPLPTDTDLAQSARSWAHALPPGRVLQVSAPVAQVDDLAVWRDAFVQRPADLLTWWSLSQTDPVQTIFTRLAELPAEQRPDGLLIEAAWGTIYQTGPDWRDAMLTRLQHSAAHRQGVLKKWQQQAAALGLVSAVLLPDVGIWRVPEAAEATWVERRDLFMTDPGVRAACRQWMDWIEAEDFAAVIVVTGTWRAGLVISPDGIDVERSPLVRALYRAAGR